MTTATFEEFKTKFDRDFTFSETLPDIREADFNNANEDAMAVFNQDLIPVVAVSKNALLNLIAHFLTLNIDISDTGAQSKFLQSSKSVGSISESAQIPDWISNNAEFSIFATTSFGLKFIMLSAPYLGGAAYCVGGSTQP